MDILSPEGAVLKEPEQVERALAAMWEQAGEKATGKKESHTATRVCVANLIVVGKAADWDDIIEVLGELSPVYPTRTIVLLAEDTTGENREAASGVRASVSALCHVPQPGSPQVCCDQIILRCKLDGCEDLGRTILPMLESDVPVMVWWTLDPAECAPLFTTMRELATRLILDAGVAGFQHLSPVEGCAIRDLAWYRTLRWRELVAGMFDECATDETSNISGIYIEVGDRTAEVIAASTWLVAFMAGQLGWKPVKARIAVPGVITTVEFIDDGRPIEATISQATGEGLVGITVVSGNNTFEAKRCGEELRIIVHDEHVCQVPRNVYLPRRRRSQALAAAVAGRQVDASFDRASPIAAWIAKSI